MPHDIVILGVFVADAAFRCDRLPVLGETKIATGFTLGPGGKGSNQAVAAAKAGGDVGFISRIGKDTFGQMGLQVWAAAGVHPLVTQDPDHPTGAAGIFIEEGSGRNAILISPGAAGAITSADLAPHAAIIGGAKVAMTQLEQPVEVAYAFCRMARAGGAITILNPAPAAALPADLLGLCDFVTPNETEAEALTGIAVTDTKSATAAAKVLLAQGVRQGAIITLGANGALFCDQTGARHVPPIHAGPVRDTTGAGDAFNGGFACALAQWMELNAAFDFATAVAAISVTRMGTAEAMPSRAEVMGLLQR